MSDPRNVVNGFVPRRSMRHRKLLLLTTPLCAPCDEGPDLFWGGPGIRSRIVVALYYGRPLWLIEIFFGSRLVESAFPLADWRPHHRMRAATMISRLLGDVGTGEIVTIGRERSLIAARPLSPAERIIAEAPEYSEELFEASCLL